MGTLMPNAVCDHNRCLGGGWAKNINNKTLLRIYIHIYIYIYIYEVQVNVIYTQHLLLIPYTSGNKLKYWCVSHFIINYMVMK